MLANTLIEIISLKSARLKLLFSGHPTIIIKKGKILRDSLKRLRLTIDDLNMLMREQGIFSIKDVDYAIFKTVGKQPVTKADLKIITPTPHYMPTVIILDGNFVDKIFWN